MAKTTQAADSPAAALARKRWAKTTAKERARIMRKVRAGGAKKRQAAK